MIDSTIDKIVKALPKGFRHKWVTHWFMFNELPGEKLWKLCPPDENRIQEKTGFFRWQTVGEFDDDVDVIVLYPEHYKRLLPILKQALVKVGLETIPIINSKMTPARISFEIRLRDL